MTKVNENDPRAILWGILDNIDSSSDAIKPSNEKGYRTFYEATMKRVKKRHAVLKSDGYDLFEVEEPQGFWMPNLLGSSVRRENNDTVTAFLIPAVLVETARYWGHNNHSQTLERLRERGGLARCELVAVLEGRNYHHMTFAETDIALQGIVRK